MADNDKSLWKFGSLYGLLFSQRGIKMVTEKTITAKEVATYFTKIAKWTPNAPVFLSCDEEGNSYSTIEAPNTKAFSSFSIILTKDKKQIKSVIIYPWKEGLDDKDVGLLEDDE